MIIPATPPSRTGIVTSMMDADGTTADRTTQGRGTGTPHMRTTNDTSSAPAYASRLAPTSGPAHRLAPDEPVFVLWGERL